MRALRILGYGVSVRPGDRQFDPVPLLGILAALAITRGVIGARLTPLTAALAAFGGALWAFTVGRVGTFLPTFVALVVILALRAAHAEAAARHGT
jgi:hypothetical protein